MGGNWQTYRCERCPLVLEFGGLTLTESGTVYAETHQIACAGCGTMHRLIEERGACQVTALPGPVRSSRTETLRDIAGEEIEVEVWFTEADWQPVGECAGGIEAVSQFRCRYCGQVGRMLSHERFLYPDGYKRGAPRREECPVCLGPMACIGVSDAI